MSLKNPELIVDPRPVAGMGRFPGVDTERESYSTGSSRNRLSPEEKTFLYQALSGLRLRPEAMPFVCGMLECARNRNGYRMLYWARFEERWLVVCPSSSGEMVMLGTFKWTEGDGSGAGVWTFRPSAAFRG